MHDFILLWSLNTSKYYLNTIKNACYLFLIIKSIFKINFCTNIKQTATQIIRIEIKIIDLCLYLYTMCAYKITLWHMALRSTSVSNKGPLLYRNPFFLWICFCFCIYTFLWLSFAHGPTVPAVKISHWILFFFRWIIYTVNMK